MANVIYCHQCAYNNPLSQKFCTKCRSPLWLVGIEDDPTRSCPNCSHVNPSFAHFCVQCSTPLIPNAPKKPDGTLPFAFKNINAVGLDRCPACGRPPTDLVSSYVLDIKKKNLKADVHYSTGITSGVIMGPQIRISSGLLEPHPGFATGYSKQLFTGGLGCFLAVLLAAIGMMILPFVRNNSLFLLLITTPLGFFLANRLYKRLLRPYLTQVEAARARWRQAHICLPCDAVFIPKEGLYTSPDHLDRLVWSSPNQS